MYTCMCDWVTLLYSRKLTEHCKPAIMEKIKIIIKKKFLGVAIMAQWKQIRLGTVRLQVQSLVSLSRLRFWHCHELWCSLKMKLRSCVAAAVV